MAKKSKPDKPLPKLPNVWQLTVVTWRVLWLNRRLFLGLALVYGLLNLIFVQGLAGGVDVSSLKHTLNQAFSGSFGPLTSALGVFTVLVGSAGSGSTQAAGAYQLVLGIVTSLAVIWALRQLLAGSTVRMRDAYYLGMYPLVPFVLVLLVIGLQLLPFAFGSGLYNMVVASGIAVGWLETLGWLFVFVAGLAWSVYMVSSSLFALYVVTLPDMTPMKALRSARELVKGRRWPVILRLAFLPVILLVVSVAIMVPIIIVVAFLAKWIFFLLSMFVLIVINAYIYTLYRELLNE